LGVIGGIVAEDVELQLKTNEELWRTWLARGITPGMAFVVDFHFYVPKEKVAKAMASSLEEAGFSVKISTTRTLFILRAWEIEASVKHQWTLEYLNERTKEFCRSADECGFSFEGIGAEMP
jgi:hypothetical protein